MEDFLKKLKEAKTSADFGSKKDQIRMWYNPEGDCIHFQTAHVAIIRDRIDEYLTIYRSAETKEPIGFQVKDVRALVEKYYYDLMVIKAGVKEGRLVSVTSLLVRLLSATAPSIGQTQGYAEALRTLPKEADSFLVPA